MEWNCWQKCKLQTVFYIFSRITSIIWCLFFTCMSDSWYNYQWFTHTGTGAHDAVCWGNVLKWYTVSCFPDDPSPLSPLLLILYCCLTALKFGLGGLVSLHVSTYGHWYWNMLLILFTWCRYISATYRVIAYVSSIA